MAAAPAGASGRMFGRVLIWRVLIYGRRPAAAVPERLDELPPQASREGMLARPDCPQPRFALDAAVLILAFARRLLGDRRFATTVSCRFPHRNAVLVARLKRCLHINRAIAESYTARPPAAMPKRLEESHRKKHNVNSH